jgi:hypothetical protein
MGKREQSEKEIRKIYNSIERFRLYKMDYFLSFSSSLFLAYVFEKYDFPQYDSYKSE